MARFRPKVFESEERGDWKKQEARVAKTVGGKVQAGSGNSVYAKGDVKQQSEEAMDLERFLIECKHTQKKSLSIKGEWLSKISREAIAAGKMPALSFEIAGNDDRMVEHDWVAIPMSVFKRLLGD